MSFCKAALQGELQNITCIMSCIVILYQDVNASLPLGGGGKDKIIDILHSHHVLAKSCDCSTFRGQRRFLAPHVTSLNGREHFSAPAASGCRTAAMACSSARSARTYLTRTFSSSTWPASRPTTVTRSSTGTCYQTRIQSSTKVKQSLLFTYLIINK